MGELKIGNIPIYTDVEESRTTILDEVDAIRAIIKLSLYSSAIRFKELIKDVRKTTAGS